MRIFGKKKKENLEELTLRRVEKEHSFDVFAMLAKALLLFLIVYGAVGGFLSAYEIDYNKGISMMLIFFFALFLSMVYEIGKRWLMNLVNMFVLFAYFYFAITNYWVINSGYYAILNRVLEVAREYLNISNGTDYALMVEDEYLSVTLFVLFISMVGCIFLNIHLQNKASLLKILIPTFSPYIFPFYFEKTPDLIYILFLFIGYTAVAILHGTNVREKLSGQMRYILPLVAAFVIVLVRMAAFIVPRESYENSMPQNPYKGSTEKAAAAFAQFGMMALFQGDATGGGVSGGVLGQGSSPVSDYETDLIVRYTPYSFQPVYLKAYTGKDYDGTKWSQARDEMPEDGKMQVTAQARRAAYWENPEAQGRGIMEIENVGASRIYDYKPYYTDEEATWQDGNVTVYTYYPAEGQASVPLQEIDEAYLEVPDRCLEAVAYICEQAGFKGTPEEIAQQVIDYFQVNYRYTLRPGYNFRGLDYITYFLLESKRGFCAHFASAGTMLFRYMGIPARYVEGYVFSYFDIIDSGELVEEASYADYYRGYSPFGETALVQLEVPDARAHGWVEIYVQGKGWVVVDPTPASTETDTTSFWDAFMNSEGDDDNDNALGIGADTIGAYLERALGGISVVMLIVGTMALAGMGIGYGIRRHKEQALPLREQVKLHYQRLKKSLGRKHEEFARYRTVKEQLDFMRQRFGVEVSSGQEEALYAAFFGEESDRDYAALLELIKDLRKRTARR